MRKYFWTDGSPLSVTFYASSKEPWLPSWNIYLQFLQWQNQHVKYIRIGGDFLMADYHRRANLSVVTLTKANRITSFIESEDFINGYHCALLLLWHPSAINWIKIPCDKKILDKATVGCSNKYLKVKEMSTQKKIYFKRYQLRRFRDLSVLKLVFNLDLKNIFYCKDGMAISIRSVCDGISDCTDSYDEYFCNCKFMGQQMLNSRLCASKCQRPTCICHLPFHQLHNSGCKPFISHTFSAMERLKYYNCHNITIKCIYDLVSKSIREQKFCKTGFHLKDCEYNECLTSFKCLKYYCLPWKYVCDGYWDCLHGYDEFDCNNIEVLPGFYKCSNSSTIIILQNICDGSNDCPNGEDELHCDFPSVSCPQTCNCVAYGISCSNSTAFHIENIKTYPKVYLSIESSEIHDVNFLMNHKILKFVRISCSNLSQICFWFSNNASVRTLDLSNNMAVYILKKCFVNFPSLKVFAASQNMIKHLQCLAFVDVVNIYVIDLSNNRLDTLKYCQFHGIKELKILNVSLNFIKNIHETFLKRVLVKQISLTSSFLCCLKLKPKSVQCISQKPENICIRVLDSKTLKICAGIISMLGICLNLFCVILNLRRYLNIKGVTNQKQKSQIAIISANFSGNCCYCIISDASDFS